MQLSEEYIDCIRKQFVEMQCKEDLLALLNYSKNIIYPLNEDYESKPLRLKSLSFYADYRLSLNKRYETFTIKKKTGKDRNIAAPRSGLKLIQRCLNLVLVAIYEPKTYVTGFVNEKSIVDNARIHAGKRYIYNIDLQDFFATITLHRVKATLGTEPFNLKDTREPLAFLIANLCCIEISEKVAVLPQGAPTSPVLSNIICQKLDKRLSGLARRFGAKYSRYADDITFSADNDAFNQEFKTEMRRIIEDQGFKINESKVRLQSDGYRQEVTGLTVNEKANVSKRYIRSVRAMLNNWEKLGYEQAERKFLQFYQADKGYIKKAKPSFRLVLWGKLQYLKMVRGKTDVISQKYLEQYERLNKQTTDSKSVDLELILDTWEKQGIVKAIDLYEQQISF